MKQKYVVLPQFFVAFLILGVSVYKTSSVKYVFSQAPSPTPSVQNPVNVNYILPNPSITPGNPLWPVKAFFDKADNTPETYLKNADVRLVAGKEMVERGKVEEGYLVLEKAAQYLLESYELSAQIENKDTKQKFLYEISMASLKHREILEVILSTAPDDGRAVVTRILDAPKKVYEKSSSDLTLSGLVPPLYPF